MSNYLLILILCLFFSCKNETPTTPPIIRTSFQESPLDSAFAKVRPEVQSFQINTNKTNTIKASKGTEILIPENSFVDHLGQPVSDDIEIEVIEAFSLSDFVSSGLTTLSDGKLLLSNGMMHIDAKANGQSLQLKEDAELTINMPTIKANDGYQIFTGDGKNWTVDSSALEQDYLIPLPLDLLYGDYYHIDFWAEFFWGTIYFGDLDSLTNPKFENTLIATTEFRNRSPYIMYMSNWLSMLDQKDHFFEKQEYFVDHSKLNSDLFDIYLNHPNEKIEVLDSMALHFFEQYYEKNKTELENFIKELDNYYHNKNKHSHGEFSHFLFHGSTVEDEFRSISDFFKDIYTDKGKIKVVNNHGIDLNVENSYERLKNLNLNSKEINSILSYHLRREAKINKLERVRDAVQDKTKVKNLYESTSFSTSQMGWINCDLFYSDPEAAPAEILAIDNSNNDLEFIDFSLVIPEMNVRLMSFQRKNGQYGFTKEEGPYTKLPIGKEAVIVGVSMQNDSLFYGFQKIKIEDDLSVAINMKYTTTSEFKKSLERVFKAEI